ncbi:MAG: M48 family metallopeptidase [Candidatus Paceibacterota bacterium]
MKELFLRDEKGDIKVFFRRHRRSKYLRITISPNGDVLVTRPMYVTEERAISFLNEKMDWVRKKLSQRTKNTDPDIEVRNPEHYLEHKEKARKLVEKKVSYWNEFYGFNFNRISIRNQKSRWGSCSSKKNLNFNYKIVFLKEELQDYLIVHELCHLKHLNHSKDFWSLVAEAIPRYEDSKKELKQIYQK